MKGAGGYPVCVAMVVDTQIKAAWVGLPYLALMAEWSKAREYSPSLITAWV